MPGTSRPTGSHQALPPPHDGVGRPWLLLVAGLLVTALASITLRPVCLIDVPGARESAIGVRHLKRSGTWYHCEPWIQRVLRD